ncbi:DUF1077-domain-containing protein [Meredithblackwellia eburnea MCA 4105]
MSSHASTSRWSLDYNANSVKSPSVAPPPGFSSPTTSSKGSKVTTTSQIQKRNLENLRQQKAWEVAVAPAKSVPMQAFMMYMTGGGVQIFSVMSVWSCLKGAVSGLLSVEKAFAPFTSASSSSTAPTSSPSNSTPTASFSQQKLVYILCQFALLGVGLWKCGQMGLLPTHDSDWLAFRSLGDGSGWAERTSVSAEEWVGI